MLILFLMWQVGDAFNNWNAKKELRSIASSPESDHVFKVDSFKALDKISNTLEKSIIAIEGMGTFRCQHLQVFLQPEEETPNEALWTFAIKSRT